MSADNRVVPLVIPSATNREFLEYLFGDQWSQVLVTSFSRDPADTTQPREDWNAWFAGDVLANTNFDQGNTYFCPSLLVPGTKDRRVDYFRALYVIVIDDIGTKVNLDGVVNLLKCQPTYLIETSPGNHQAGWKIEPEVDLAWVKGMLTQLDRALGGADNLTNPVAWRRLPVGRNTKKAWTQQLGPQGFKVRLRRGYPGPMIRGLDWPCDIEPQIGVITPLTTLNRGGLGDSQRPDALVLAQDPIYRALEEAGMILGDKLTSDKFWAATIRCPWVTNHGPTRPLTGAEYVPAIPGQRGWFHCFHCERRTQPEFREQLDVVLRDDGQKIVAAFEFDEIDPALFSATVVPGPRGEVINLWDQKTPPAWPGGVLPAVIEDALHELAERDGLDLGALGAAMITAASGAADKRSTLTPYAGSQWSVPPILWLMLIAEPGLRKTAILGYLLGRLRKRNAERMRAYARAMASWRLLPAPQRGQAPVVQALLAEDTTIEKVQEWMADNPRGMLYLRDELASLFEFGRYSTGTGAAERANFLEFYEGGPLTIGRMSRTTSIDNCALSIIGGIQPHRLADFKGLANDGLLPRFGTLLMQRRDTSSSTTRKTTPPDTSAIETTIERLLVLGPDAYHTDTAGEDMIRGIENMSEVLAQRPDLGVGYSGFLHKLHGVHARVALVLHLIDGGQDQVVPADTVYRAALYANFLLDHAEVFYAGLPGSAEHIARAIGSYILRHPTDRVTAGQLRRDVAACRRLRSLTEIQEAVFLLVIGGWLVPETSYPSNQAWRVRPGLQDQFAARAASEVFRVESIKQAMNHRGLYRGPNKEG